jgi:Ring finger domain
MIEILFRSLALIPCLIYFSKGLEIFEIDLGAHKILDSSNYTIIKPTLVPETRVFIVGKFDSSPKIFYDPQKETITSDADLFSIESFNNDTCTLIIPPLAYPTEVFIKLFSFEKILDSNVRGANPTLEITQNLNPYFSSKCSGKGKWYENTCLCQEGYGGKDCSVPLQIIDLGVHTLGTIPAYNFKFFLIRLTKTFNDPRIRVKGESGSKIFYYSFYRRYNNILPSFYSFNESYYLNNSLEENINDYEKVSFVASIFCAQNSPCNYELSYIEKIKDETMLALFIHVITTLCIIGCLGFPLLLICWYKPRRCSQSISINSIDELNLVCREIVWNVQPIDEQVCCVCLDHYSLADKVRVLRCSHFFHSKCIEKWVFSHPRCPMCKSSIKK